MALSRSAVCFIALTFVLLTVVLTLAAVNCFQTVSSKNIAPFNAVSVTQTGLHPGDLLQNVQGEVKRLALLTDNPVSVEAFQAETDQVVWAVAACRGTLAVLSPLNFMATRALPGWQVSLYVLQDLSFYLQTDTVTFAEGVTARPKMLFQHVDTTGVVVVHCDYEIILITVNFATGKQMNTERINFGFTPREVTSFLANASGVVITTDYQMHVLTFGETRFRSTGLGFNVLAVADNCANYVCETPDGKFQLQTKEETYHACCDFDKGTRPRFVGKDHVVYLEKGHLKLFPGEIALGLRGVEQIWVSGMHVLAKLGVRYVLLRIENSGAAQIAGFDTVPNQHQLQSISEFADGIALVGSRSVSVLTFKLPCWALSTRGSFFGVVTRTEKNGTSVVLRDGCMPMTKNATWQPGSFLLQWRDHDLLFFGKHKPFNCDVVGFTDMQNKLKIISNTLLSN